MCLRQTGTGPDHGIFDVYVGGTLWQSIDGYAVSSGERTVSLNLSEEGPMSFEIRARKEKNRASSGYTVRFKQLLLPDVAYDLHTIAYQYDLLSRLLDADYYPGLNVSATPFRAYDFAYDLAGNRLSQSLSLNGAAPTVTSYTYNAANQITNAGFTYDNNGNLTSDGANTYIWDRANRLLSMGGTSYVSDGLGNRVQQSIGVNATQYLLDLQPGLAVVLAETQGANTTRYVHGPNGIHAHKDAAGNWEWMMQDGLGSVRSVADNALNAQWTGNPEPYGVYFSESGTRQSPYLFTGEYTDPSTGMVHLRARDYNPTLGVFPSLDPFEGTIQRPMSLNGYSWVEGNAPNVVDPSGLAGRWDGCAQFLLYPGGSSGNFQMYLDCLNRSTISGAYDEAGNLIFGGWDTEARENIYGLRNSLLDSASRHNRIPNMDDNGFAALIASLIVGERRIGRVPAEGRFERDLENFVASIGCVVSGKYIRDALSNGNLGQAINYLSNTEIPYIGEPPNTIVHAYASVGIGNVKIPVAADIRAGLACNAFRECTSVQISPLIYRDQSSGTTIDLRGGPSADLTHIEYYQEISRQLQQDETNIEYVAAILEGGALRAINLGIVPTAFNSALWYAGGIHIYGDQSELTDSVAIYGADRRGHAVYWVLPNIQYALNLLGLESSWRLDRIHEPEYCAYTGRC